MTLFTAPVRADAPIIRIIPDSALMDEEVKIQLTGLPPGNTVTLQARTQWHGQAWAARATFVADGAGRVDLREHAPISGSYSSRDPMGLFWSMRPQGSRAGPARHPMPAVTDARVTRFEVEMEGRRVAVAECKRWLARPGVCRREVTANGLVGHLYEPPGPGRHPSVLVLSGSDGGTDDVEAALLASHGYTAFALAYFGVNGLPRELVNIPLEYFGTALDWLAAQDSVDANRLGVVGGSKGAELALLLATRFPQLKAVVARAPSCVVWEGIGGKSRSSSWSFGNKPLAFVPLQHAPQVSGPEKRGPPTRLVELYRRSLRDAEQASKAVIPVEKIQGGILLLSGRDDQLWPSTEMAQAVLQRLKAHGFRYPAEHLCYDGAGHGIPSACIPAVVTVSGGRWEMGGSPEANAKAQADSRPKVLRFVKQNLDPGGVSGSDKR
jgi:dienelactone hydrolase